MKQIINTLLSPYKIPYRVRVDSLQNTSRDYLDSLGRYGISPIQYAKAMASTNPIQSRESEDIMETNTKIDSFVQSLIVNKPRKLCDLAITITVCVTENVTVDISRVAIPVEI